MHKWDNNVKLSKWELHMMQQKYKQNKELIYLLSMEIDRNK